MDSKESSAYFPWPLKGFEGLPPLPEEKNEDGKSYKNPQHGISSKAYDTFSEPLDNSRRGGFDVHIYHDQNQPDQATFAKALWERIRREFPELRIYTFFDRPIGPHTRAMFEVNVFTPGQFGAFIPWLSVHRGPLSVLVHPNTTADDEKLNHTERAIWLGERLPLEVSVLER